MAPTVVLRDEQPRLVLGSAGSNRIRSAIVQTISRVLDEGLWAPEAVQAPRLHPEDGIVYSEPGIDLEPLRRAGRTVAPFRARNLFFGGVQATQREMTQAASGAPGTGVEVGRRWSSRPSRPASHSQSDNRADTRR